ncbi:MAG: PilZ domain-containing protein [Candidatus Omnitrophica bacterium]|nr:PilZ domain-containing protein [Candidatus Omnitrophota bacterium]
MDTERRIFERFWARFPAKFKDTRGDFGRDVFLRNASASGAHIVTRDRMLLDDRVALEVEVPDGGLPMLLSGRVVWSRPAHNAGWDIGLRFDQINFMRIQRLFKFTLAS